MHYVYIYRDPRPTKNNCTVYVGKGTKDRAYDHWERPSLCKNKKLKNLLNLLRRTNLAPVIEILYHFKTEKEALDKEIELIALWGREDLKKGTLFNNTDGGEGLINIGPEALSRRAKSIKATYNRPEKKAEQSRRSIQAWKNQEFRKTRVNEIRERAQDPEYCAKLAKAIKKAHSNPEVRDKISQAAKDHWASQDYRDKRAKSLSATIATPEHKERRGSATKAGWQNEETRRKRTEGIQAAQTPEMIAKRSEANRTGWTNEKRAAFSEQMRVQCQDPAHLERRSSAAKKAWARRKAKDAG